MRKAFEFQEGWRTYRCRVAPQPAAANGANWWWFEVSGDGNQYALFPTASSDTQENVKARVLAFHTHRLERLAEPPQPRNRPGRPPMAKAKGAGTAAAKK